MCFTLYPATGSIEEQVNLSFKSVSEFKSLVAVVEMKTYVLLLFI